MPSNIPEFQFSNEGKTKRPKQNHLRLQFVHLKCAILLLYLSSNLLCPLAIKVSISCTLLCYENLDG